MSANASASQEITARVEAIRKARFQAKSMWSLPGLPWKLRRINIICQVVNSALSGLGPFVVTDKQTRRLDAEIAVACRSALKGQALDRDAEGGIVGCMSTRDLLHYWDLATAKTELLVRRLCWFVV